jgi:hypothetical protein
VDKVKAFFVWLWTWIVEIVKSIGNLILRYPLASALTILLVVGAVFLSAFGQRIQIGGILGKLWGKKKPDVRNVPPEDRVTSDGKIIQPGESDDKGFVQTPATKTIKNPGLFSDPNSVVIVESDGKKKEIPLPTGVKNKDVKEVTEISPNVYEVKNNDKGTDMTSLIELLEKK